MDDFEYSRLFKDKDIYKIACIFAGLMCIVNLLPLSLQTLSTVTDYSVGIVGFWIVMILFEYRQIYYVPIFISIIVLFNPLWPTQIYIEVSLWKVLSVLSAFSFITFSKFLETEHKYRDITDEEAEMIRLDYQKIQELKQEAEEERNKARTAREHAEHLRKKAEQEWEAVKNRMGEDLDDPYTILGVHKTDSLATIKGVYKKLVAIYHPDTYQKASDISKKQKNELMAKINVSYEWILKHH